MILSENYLLILTNFTNNSFHTVWLSDLCPHKPWIKICVCGFLCYWTKTILFSFLMFVFVVFYKVWCFISVYLFQVFGLSFSTLVHFELCCKMPVWGHAATYRKIVCVTRFYLRNAVIVLFYRCFSCRFYL